MNTAINRTLLCASVALGATLTPSLTQAELYGPLFAEGDAWQNGIQEELQTPLFASTLETVFFKAPFYTPKAKSHGLTTTRNQAVPVTLEAKHVSFWGFDTTYLRWKITEAPRHGTLSGTPPEIVYTPNPDYTGFDSFVFEAKDLSGNSGQGTIDIKVNGSYTLFESGQVRPLALNSRGDRLYALNTPDGKLEVFDTRTDTPKHLASITVGLEPVAIALRNDNEAWVVNTLSDSVAIVDVSDDQPRIVKTLNVGDEPQDIVFAGQNRGKAFISTARRGQHSPSGLKPTTPSIGRADVWVFDAQAPKQTPEDIVTLFGMAPRGLAVSADGERVYVAIYKSGNKSVTISHNGRDESAGVYSTKFGKPGPQDDAGGIIAPNTGLIAKHDGEHWRDLYGTIWDRDVYFNLPDYDVFELNANDPAAGATQRFTGVGNALFNMTVNPVNNALYVSNMDARNELKFEGHGKRSDVQTLRGRFIQNQITVINANGTVTPRDINPHLDDARPDGSADDNAKSLSMPLEMAIDSTGQTLYVTAYGSSKIGIFGTEALETGRFTASESNQIEVSGGGPAGIILDEANERLFVLTRFNNAIAVIDTTQNKEIASVPMYNPEPDFIVEGRPFLYDARFSSGRGDASCGSCHLFGDMDGIAWELGNPDGYTTENPRPYANKMVSAPALRVHHPLKGPMLTQSLRGLEFQGPQHWRGDKTGKARVGGESLERAAFKEFSGAFTELLGRHEEPTDDEMNKFADFVLQLRYPPNPNRNLDDTLTPKAQAGADTYFNDKSTGFKSHEDKIMVTCNDCHEVNASIERFGTNTLMSFEGVENEQDQKIPHLRNVYSRVGMFGQVIRAIDNTSTGRFMGDQVTGYGLSHDGIVDTLENFLTVRVFHVPTENVDDLFEYVTQVPTGLAPIVGQQATLSPSNQSQRDLVNTMIDQALQHQQGDTPAKPQCDLIAWGSLRDKPYAFVLQNDGRFLADNGQTFSSSALQLYTRWTNSSLNFMCTPPGSGHRMSVDRDEDGALNQQDTVIAGRMPTSVSPANPDAPTQYLTFNADDPSFLREQNQRSSGIFPDFLDFDVFSASDFSEEETE